jgi:hypothetical protein
LLSVPDPRVVRSDSAIRLNGTGFNHDQSGTFECVMAESRNVVVGESAGLGSGRRGTVLAHRCHEDAVAKGGRADLKWLKERWSGGGEVDRLAGRVLVHWSEVRNVWEGGSRRGGCGLVLGYGAHRRDVCCSQFKR